MIKAVPLFCIILSCFQERHQILEEMGISVQDSGIGVKEGRYFLVNLNADPSLNELLVYYLKVISSSTRTASFATCFYRFNPQVFILAPQYTQSRHNIRAVSPS